MEKFLPCLLFSIYNLGLNFFIDSETAVQVDCILLLNVSIWAVLFRVVFKNNFLDHLVFSFAFIVPQRRWCIILQKDQNSFLLGRVFMFEAISTKEKTISMMPKCQLSTFFRWQDFIALLKEISVHKWMFYFNYQNEFCRGQGFIPLPVFAIPSIQSIFLYLKWSTLWIFTTCLELFIFRILYVDFWKVRIHE